MENLSVEKERKIGIILSYVQTIFSAVISIIYIPILLNGIGQDEYGLYQIMGSVISYFSTVYSSLNAAVMKNYTEFLITNDTKKMENTLAISKRIFFVISVLIIIVSIPVAILFRKVYSNSLSSQQLDESLWMFAVMIANLLVYLNNSIYSASIMAHEKFVFIRSLTLISQIIQPIAVILFIRKFPYAVTITVIQLILNIFIALANEIYCKAGLCIKIVYHGKDTSLVKDILSLSGSVLFVSFADQIFWKTDQLILGQMYGTAIVAIYSIGSQINTIYIHVGTTMSSVLLPMVSKIISTDKNGEKLSKTFAEVGRYQSIVLMLIFSGVILYGKEFIKLIAGDEYLPAYYVALLLMVPYTVDLIQNMGNTILQAKNMYWYRARILFIAAIINIGLTIVMSKYFGIYGAAGATSISIVVTSWFVMNYIYSAKVNLNISLFWKTVAPIWLYGVLPFSIGMLINKIILNNAYLSFAVHVILYIVVYCFIIFVVILNKDEKEKIIKRFKTKF